jgi:CTP:molybdopterin cytidylyltransferase MocA
MTTFVMISNKFTYTLGTIKKNSAAIILSGGESTRMNFPKAFLSFGGKCFAHQLTEVYRQAGIDKIVLVIHHRLLLEPWLAFIDSLPIELTIVPNRYPDYGRLFSIQLGLTQLSESSFCFIQNIDNPYITTEIIHKIWDAKNDKGYCKPIYQNKGGHPVLLSPSVIQHIRSITTNNKNLHLVLSAFPETEVAMNNDTIHINVNTPEDYSTHLGLRQSL